MQNLLSAIASRAPGTFLSLTGPPDHHMYSCCYSRLNTAIGTSDACIRMYLFIRNNLGYRVFSRVICVQRIMNTFFLQLAFYDLTDQVLQHANYRNPDKHPQYTEVRSAEHHSEEDGKRLDTHLIPEHPRSQYPHTKPPS